MPEVKIIGADTTSLAEQHCAKAGVTSWANGKLTPDTAKSLPGDGLRPDYVSTSISPIMHGNDGKDS
jgi:hypothetical protein